MAWRGADRSAAARPWRRRCQVASRSPPAAPFPAAPADALLLSAEHRLHSVREAQEGQRGAEPAEGRRTRRTASPTSGARRKTPPPSESGHLTGQDGVHGAVGGAMAGPRRCWKVGADAQPPRCIPGSGRNWFWGARPTTPLPRPRSTEPNVQQLARQGGRGRSQRSQRILAASCSASATLSLRSNVRNFLVSLPGLPSSTLLPCQPCRPRRPRSRPSSPARRAAARVLVGGGRPRPRVHPAPLRASPRRPPTPAASSLCTLLNKPATGAALSRRRRAVRSAPRPYPRPGRPSTAPSRFGRGPARLGPARPPADL